MELTVAQWRVIEWVRKSLIAAVVGETYATKHEIKTFDVRGEGRWALLVIEFGRIGDEGTAAEVFCREYFAWIVGPKGGCRRVDSAVRYAGHPGATHFLPRTKREQKERARARRLRARGKETER